TCQGIVIHCSAEQSYRVLGVETRPYMSVGISLALRQVVQDSRDQTRGVGFHISSPTLLCSNGRRLVCFDGFGRSILISIDVPKVNEIDRAQAFVPEL